MRLVGVPLSADQVTRFYEGFSNGVLWPLFHYLLDQIPLQVSHWDGYVEANEAFADVVAAHYRPGDMIWVHDYQLFLLPGPPARAAARAPASGSSSTSRFPPKSCSAPCPARDRLLQGMLGADLVGFHTPAYLRHFATSLTDILGLLGRDRPGAAARARGPARRRSRWAWTPRRSPRWPTIRRSTAKSTPSGATAASGSSWASTGSTTPRAFPRRLLAFERMLQTASGPAGEGAAGAGGGAVAHQRRRLPGFPRAGGRAGRADQRRVRHAALGAGALHLPRRCPSPTWSRSTARPT